MKAIKLDRRYKPCKLFGFKYAIQFTGKEAAKISAARNAIEQMHDKSKNLYPFIEHRHIWKDIRTFFETVSWAYYYDRYYLPSAIYFRTKEDMDRVLVIVALTDNA